MNDSLPRLDTRHCAPDVLLEKRMPVENLTTLSRANGAFECAVFAEDVAYLALFDAFYRAFHRSSPRHILLVRERGTGDRAILLELASRALRGNPSFLVDKEFLMLNFKSLMNDEMRYALEAMASSKSISEKTVMCLDNVGHLLRTLGGEYSSLWTSSILNCPARIVALVSPVDFEEFFASDPDSQDLFSEIRLPEPSCAAAIALVHHFTRGLEHQFRVEIPENVIKRTVILSENFLLNERLPQKALTIIRNVCEDIEFGREIHNDERNRIREEDVLAKISERTGLPYRTVAGIGDNIDYHSSFNEIVFGQPHAVQEAVTELNLIKAGMADPTKPASVMMFIGQTGTGKTELAKALARFYSPSRRLKTFTLGNFSEPHSVSGIIGVPPGYVGHERGGRLINELNADPYSVFLLDEADKAHPDVMQPFLNLFDEGWIADQRGTRAHASRAIFILTTNVGQRQIAEMCRSGKSLEEITVTMKESLARIRHSKSNRPVFSSEFLARIKRIIVFRSLDKEAMLGISRRLANEICEAWVAKRQKTLVISEPLLTAIATKGHLLDEKSQGREGGRVIRKLLADFVESPLQIAIGAAPDEYRRARHSFVDYSPPVDAPPSSISKCWVRIRFEPGSCDTIQA